MQGMDTEVDVPQALTPARFTTSRLRNSGVVSRA
jgi:hypothetical protein